MALDNKLGLTSTAELDREEERISKKKAAQLFDRKLLPRLRKIPKRQILYLQE